MSINKDKLAIKQIISLFVFLFISFFFIISILFYPFIRGKYRFNKFINRIHQGMNREQVHKIAKDIGYDRLDLEIVDEKIFDNTKDIAIDKIYDVYYFKNIMLNSVVSIRYDKKGNVLEIVID